MTTKMPASFLVLPFILDVKVCVAQTDKETGERTLRSASVTEINGKMETEDEFINVLADGFIRIKHELSSFYTIEFPTIDEYIEHCGTDPQAVKGDVEYHTALFSKLQKRIESMEIFYLQETYEETEQNKEYLRKINLSNFSGESLQKAKVLIETGLKSTVFTDEMKRDLVMLLRKLAIKSSPIYALAALKELAKELPICDDPECDACKARREIRDMDTPLGEQLSFHPEELQDSETSPKFSERILENGVIDIKGLDKAEVLVALFNASKQQGMGYLNTAGYDPMTLEDARKIIEENPNTYFDYLRGRVMKVKLSEDTFSAKLYDRDNGKGAAARALEPLFIAALN